MASESQKVFGGDSPVQVVDVREQLKVCHSLRKRDCANCSDGSSQCCTALPESLLQAESERREMPEGWDQRILFEEDRGLLIRADDVLHQNHLSAAFWQKQKLLHNIGT